MGFSRAAARAKDYISQNSTSNWECGLTTACESLSKLLSVLNAEKGVKQNLVTILTTKRMCGHKELVLDTWYHLLEAYIGLSLALLNDGMVATSAIVKLFRKHFVWASLVCGLASSFYNEISLDRYSIMVLGISGPWPPLRSLSLSKSQRQSRRLTS
jgi:hypothetical protein